MTPLTKLTGSKMLCSQMCSHGNFRQKGNYIMRLSYNTQTRKSRSLLCLVSIDYISVIYQQYRQYIAFLGVTTGLTTLLRES